MSRISSMARFRLAAAIEDEKRQQQKEMGRNQDEKLKDGVVTPGFFKRLEALDNSNQYCDGHYHMRRNYHDSSSSNGSGRLFPFNCSNSTSPDHQFSESQAAELYSLQADMPIKVLNGAPGYINILDGLNAWQLVSELAEAIGNGIPAAASFKHVTPTGAALGLPLNEVELNAYMLTEFSISSKKPSLAAAVARARASVCLHFNDSVSVSSSYHQSELSSSGADRMSSLGDFIALSQRCDELTAKIISRELSEGCIAPDYDDIALSILAKKKNGNYVILKIDPKYLPVDDEVRTIFGLKLKQKRNNPVISPELFLNTVIRSSLAEEDLEIPRSTIEDLLVATITVKYTQSNSVCLAYRGQVIGLGSGQHSRLNCARLAGEKAANWWLRQNERILNLPWKVNVRRIEKMAIIDTFVGIHSTGPSISSTTSMDGLSVSNSTTNQLLPQQNNCLTTETVMPQKHNWNNYFTETVMPFSQKERKDWLEKLSDVVCVASDTLFLSLESIECVKQFGAKYIVCMGSNNEIKAEIIENCKNNGIVLIQTSTPYRNGQQDFNV